MTGKSSDFNPDEEYETQYLSQVSRRGFFGATASSKPRETTHIEKEQVVEEEFYTSPGIKIQSKRKKPTKNTDA